MNKEHEELFSELSKYGANSNELNFWKEMLPHLNEQEKDKLVSSLKKQVGLLKEKAELQKKDI